MSDQHHATLSGAGPGAADRQRGFAVPVQEAQGSFRALMMALAEPGTVHRMPVPAGCCPGFSSAMTAVALTLADFETSIWVAAGASSEAAAYLRFQTGARIVDDRQASTFAFVPRGMELPALSTFAQGNLEYPDRSTTVVVDVDELLIDQGWRLSGPGIAGERCLVAAPLPPDLLQQLAANHAAFPCGVDLLFCCGSLVAGLPRSTSIAAT